MTSPVLECPACESAMRELYRTSMSGEPWMYRCDVCGMCRVAPVPTALDESYEDAYTAGPDADRKNRRLAPDYLRKMRPHLPTGKFRLLEIGGSYGWLAQLVRDEYQADVLLLEPGCTAVKNAGQRGLNAQAGFLEQYEPDQPFDAVCAAHVIEHVQDIGAFLAACRRVLRPGAILLLFTPNADAWKLSLFGSTWAWAVPDQHTHFLSSDSARRLLEKHGLEPVKIGANSPAFAHYPFFISRWLSELRSRWPAPLRKAAGIFTRPIALAEYVVLRFFDSCISGRRADELFIVATRRE